MKIKDAEGKWKEVKNKPDKDKKKQEFLELIEKHKAEIRQILGLSP
jgi:hypothetical protein